MIKKGEFVAGDVAVYFEIDAFLREGNPDWPLGRNSVVRDRVNRCDNVAPFPTDARRT